MTIALLTAASAFSARPDPLRLEARGTSLLGALEADRGALATGDACDAVLGVWAESVAPPLPAIWDPAHADRADAIRELSLGLDALEQRASGLYLAGPLSVADARLFPSVCFMHRVLPEHYGWEEWTEAAIFWKRPKLHAWFELMSYEKTAAAAARELDAGLGEVDFAAIAIEVPVYR